MNTRKSGSTRSGRARTTRPRQPKTIDLKAEEAKAAEKDTSPDGGKADARKPKPAPSDTSAASATDTPKTATGASAATAKPAGDAAKSSADDAQSEASTSTKAASSSSVSKSATTDDKKSGADTPAETTPGGKTVPTTGVPSPSGQPKKPGAPDEAGPKSPTPGPAKAARPPNTGPAGDRPTPVSATASPATPRPTQSGSKEKGGRTGIGALIAASIIGGLVALGILGGLNAAGVLASIPGFSGLLAEPQAPPQTTTPGADEAMTEALATLRDEIAQLRQRQDELAGQMPENGSADAAASELGERLPAVEEAVAANARRIDELADAQPVSVGGALTEEAAGRVTALEEGLARARTELSQLAQAVNETSGDASAQAVAELETRIEETRQTLDAGMGEAGARAEALSTRVSRMENALQSLSEEIGQLRAANREGAGERIARSVAINALRAAYERGEPFAAMLGSVEALTGPLEAADMLRQQADSGVATVEDLREQFSRMADDIIRQGQPQADGVVSQLLSNARSLVRVRPAGPVEGDDIVAVVSRIEDSLARDDLGGALAEWQDLPEPARRISGDWAQAVEQRLAADRAMADIEAALSSDSSAGDGSG